MAGGHARHDDNRPVCRSEFLDAGLSGREAILDHWRTEAAARLLSVQIAGRYLGGMAPGRNEVHLMKWDAPVVMFWFAEDVPLGALPFAGVVAQRQRELEAAGVAVLSGGYVRPQELRAGDRLIGEVGFAVKLKRGQPLPDGSRMERYIAGSSDRYQLMIAVMRNEA